MLLDGKSCLVTGAGSGIGRAVALAFAREGGRVVVSDLSEEGGLETVRLVEESSPEAEAAFVRADVSVPEDHETLVRAAVERFGSLEVACNNAGIGGEKGLVTELSVEGWRQVIEVDLSGVFYAMRAQIPAMLERGRGAIVNISSVLGQVGSSGVSGYVAAKHGVVGLTRAAAIETSARGVRINAVGPSYIETPLIAEMSDALRRATIHRHPIGRIGRPEEVAELVAWLASDRASFATGGYYPIDGGYLAR